MHYWEEGTNFFLFFPIEIRKIIYHKDGRNKFILKIYFGLIQLGQIIHPSEHVFLLIALLES